MTKINQVSAHPFNRPKGASRIRKVFRSGSFIFSLFGTAQVVRDWTT